MTTVNINLPGSRQVLAFYALVLCLCLGFYSNQSLAQAKAHAVVEVKKGPHGGRLLKQNGLTLELAIIEAGLPPEFRVWLSKDGQAIKPDEALLQIKLIRLGGITDDISFAAEDDYLRGDSVIYEPHSFEVDISLRHDKQEYHWRYDNFEGRVLIKDSIATALDINTAIAKGKNFSVSVPVFGRLSLAESAQRMLSARFEGLITEVLVDIGDTVEQGQSLIKIESNESLKAYTIKAPIDGVISQRLANPGEQSYQRPLLQIVSDRQLIAQLNVSASDRAKLKVGQKVRLNIKNNAAMINARITQIMPLVGPAQSTTVRVLVDNRAGELSAGLFVEAQIEVANFDVALAVPKRAIQTFRDFNVVYIKVGQQYEVRMLELGRTADAWVEVLSGLSAGSEYVIDNSFIIKADIDKEGASHDH